MKKFLIVALILSSLSARECMVDITFVNGVWNDRDSARENTRALASFMLHDAITKLNPEKFQKNYKFLFIHNPSHGKVDDLIETYYQLAESGQISTGYFLATAASLSGENDPNKLLEKIRAISQTYNEDLLTMESTMLNASFARGDNVLAVSHSQGNLFGNKMYLDMPNNYKKQYKMVSVATPAEYVMKPKVKTPYVTASGDPVIGSIPKALPANVDGIGHSFIGTYLSGSIQSPRKIALYIKSSYDAFIDACANSGNGDDANTTGGGTGTGSGSGGGSGTFDYKAQCSSITFPDPVPSELETSINTIITNAGSSIAADVVCPLIDAAVQAYNLQNGGGLPGGGGTPSIP